MDITSLYNVSSGVIKNALQTEDPGKVNDKSSDAFGGFLSAAMDNITQANAYISDAEDEKVKLAMAVKCLSARGLSQKSGINYVTLIPYLNGNREPKTEALGKIAKALEVDPAELID